VAVTVAAAAAAAAAAAPGEPKRQVNPDGSTIVAFADGSVLHEMTDGTKVHVYEDGRMVQTNADGSSLTKSRTGRCGWVRAMWRAWQYPARRGLSMDWRLAG
jgi:hypothetical protein